MDMLSKLKNLPLGWATAGLLLVALMVVSYSLVDPEPEVLPTMAIDEDLAPLQSGELDFDVYEGQDQYADLITPISLSMEDVAGGTAP